MKHGAASVRTRFVDPIWVTAAMWAFVLTGAFATALNPLSPGFLALVMLGVGAHLAGMAVPRTLRGAPPSGVSLHRGAPGPASRRRAVRDWAHSRHITSALLAVQLAAIAFFVQAYAEVVPSLDGVGFLAARNAYLEEARGVRDKLFLYTTHLTLFGIAVMFHAARDWHAARVRGLRRPRTLFNAVALAAFVAGLLTTGRTAPLLVIFGYCFYALRFALFSRRAILTGFWVASLVMFVVVAFALGKEGLGEDTDALEGLASLGRIYFFSAPVALQEVMLHGHSVSTGCANIFAYPIELAAKMGLAAPCEERELDFVFVPDATNVFTFFRAYWEDFAWGYPIAMFCTGWLIESVHAASFRRRARFAAFVFPFVLNAVVLQVFEEQLFANGSVFLYLCVFYVVCGMLYTRGGPRRAPIAHPSPLPSPAPAS